MYQARDPVALATERPSLSDTSQRSLPAGQSGCQADVGTQELLHSIVEALPGALWVKDAKTLRYLLVNSKHDELLGLSAAAILGRDDFEVIAPEHARAYRTSDILALEAGTVEIAAEPVWTSSGEQIWFATTKVAIHDEDGTPLYVIGYAENVTERRAAEEARRESEDQLRSLLANLPGAIYRCRKDKVSTMEFLSDGIQDIAGYPASDFIGNAVRTFQSIIHPDDRERVEETIGKALSRREPYGVEYRLIDPLRGARWVQERGYGTPDVDGQVRLINGMILDITDRQYGLFLAQTSQSRPT
jgi:PAS domain S-box-containing protein